MSDMMKEKVLSCTSNWILGILEILGRGTVLRDILRLNGFM